MKMKKGTLIISLILVVMALSVSAPAYMARRFVPLKGALNSGASGEAEIANTGFRAPMWVLSINVYGLKPNSVYSVWYVNEQPKFETAPAGVDTNHFKTNGSGNGRYVTTVSDYDINYWHWRYIEVYSHPDNNPGNTKDMVMVLKGDLVYGYHS